MNVLHQVSVLRAVKQYAEAKYSSDKGMRVVGAKPRSGKKDVLGDEKYRPGVRLTDAKRQVLGLNVVKH